MALYQSRLREVTNTNLALGNKLTMRLAIGGRWVTFAQFLGTLYPVITAEVIEETKIFYPIPADASAAFLTKAYGIGVTTRDVIQCLVSMSEYELANDIRRAIGLPAEPAPKREDVPPMVFNISAVSSVGNSPSPVPVPAAPTAARVGFSRSMTRARPDVNAILAQYPSLLIRINTTDVDKISKGEGIQAEIVFMQSDDAAAKRGDELFEEDVKEAETEDKVPHGYISGGAKYWHGQLPVEVKNRRRAISGQQQQAGQSSVPGFTFSATGGSK